MIISKISPLSYRVSEDTVEEYARKFTTYHSLKMERISFVFGQFRPPIAAIFAFDLVETNVDKKQNNIHINNFLVDPRIRNMGFGKKLLRHTEKKIRKFNKKVRYCTASISGSLDIRDLPYWKFSLPMYYSFAKKVIGPKVICCLNNEQVRKDNLVSSAYNLNKQNITVNFKFTKKH